MKKKMKLRMKTQKRRPGIEAIYMAYRTDVYCDFGIEKNLKHIQSKWQKLLIL